MARTALRKADPVFAVAQAALDGTLNGNTYRLGPQVGSGGEGIVYGIARRPELLAKIYPSARAMSIDRRSTSHASNDTSRYGLMVAGFTYFGSKPMDNAAASSGRQ